MVQSLIWKQRILICLQKVKEDLWSCTFKLSFCRRKTWKWCQTQASARSVNQSRLAQQSRISARPSRIMRDWSVCAVLWRRVLTYLVCATNAGPHWHWLPTLGGWMLCLTCSIASNRSLSVSDVLKLFFLFLVSLCFQCFHCLTSIFVFVILCNGFRISAAVQWECWIVCFCYSPFSSSIPWLWSALM